jgi:hypothetical protein
MFRVFHLDNEAFHVSVEQHDLRPFTGRGEELRKLAAEVRNGHRRKE